MSEHQKTPYAMSAIDTNGRFTQWQIYDAQGRNVCDIYYVNANGEATARFIVEASNAHQLLVDALREIAADDYNQLETARGIARNALAEAEEA